MVAGVLLFPGAGSAADHPSLIAIERALRPLPVRRADFPYRAAGRRIPDRADVLVRAVREAVTGACRSWRCDPGEIVVGGRSMGGRMCSMAVAGFDGDGRSAQPAMPRLEAAGLICVAYPLHPPRKPRQLRTAHFPHISTPSLFVSGTKDEFAAPAELRASLEVLPVVPEVRWVEGARHDLRAADELVAALVSDWVDGLK